MFRITLLSSLCSFLDLRLILFFSNLSLQPIYLCYSNSFLEVMNFKCSVHYIKCMFSSKFLFNKLYGDVPHFNRIISVLHNFRNLDGLFFFFLTPSFTKVAISVALQVIYVADLTLSSFLGKTRNCGLVQKASIVMYFSSLLWLWLRIALRSLDFSSSGFQGFQGSCFIL